MTEVKKAQGWAEEDRVYTVIKNTTKNQKLVFSTLNGIELAPGQTLDLRTCFRRSQVVDAAHEIASLIGTGHLKDMAADEQPGAAAPVAAGGGAPTQAEMQKRARDAKLRDISDSTSMSMLEDWMNDKDPEVAKAARMRSETLLGLRDDKGDKIPGSEETEAKPTELIRSPSTDPAVTGEAAPVAAGVVHRAQ